MWSWLGGVLSGSAAEKSVFSVREVCRFKQGWRVDAGGSVGLDSKRKWNWWCECHGAAEVGQAKVHGLASGSSLRFVQRGDLEDVAEVSLSPTSDEPRRSVNNSASGGSIG